MNKVISDWGFAFNLPAPKKYEDSDPFRIITPNHGLLAVADGLGGTGSCPHTLPADEAAQALFIQRAYPGLDASFYSAALKEIFADPVNGQVTRTSAFISSRIVLPNFVALMKDLDLTSLGDDAVFERRLAEVSAHIKDCLGAVAEAFHLVVSAAVEQLLPTTLAAIIYQYDEDGQLWANTLWAGDSRAYAYFAEEGKDKAVSLVQLSQDDEDEGGTITNYFLFAPERVTLIHHRLYKLPSKAILFVCSDGLFDPFGDTSEALAIDVNLLGAISGVPTSPFLHNVDLQAEQWSANLQTLYREHYQQDDISVALSVVGVGSFANLNRDMCTNKDCPYLKAKELFEEVHANGDLLNCYSSEDRQSILNYIPKRISQRYSIGIAPTLADLYLSGATDFALTPLIRETLLKEAKPASKGDKSDPETKPTLGESNPSPVAEVSVPKEDGNEQLQAYLRSTILANPGAFKTWNKPVKDPAKIADLTLRGLAEKVFAAAQFYPFASIPKAKAFEVALDAFLAAVFADEKGPEAVFPLLYLRLARSNVEKAKSLADAAPKEETKPQEEAEPQEEAKDSALTEEEKPTPQASEAQDAQENPPLLKASETAPVSPSETPEEEKELLSTREEVLRVLGVHQEAFVEDIARAYGENPEASSALDLNNFKPTWLRLFRHLKRIDDAGLRHIEELHDALEKKNLEAERKLHDIRK